MTLPDAPEEVLRAALRALDEHDHARITALTDPQSLREYFEGYCEASRPMTLERFAKRLGMAPAAAIEKYDQWRRQNGGSLYPSLQFRGLGVSSHAELVALGPEEYLTRSMQRSDDVWDLVQRLRKHGRDVPPELLTTPSGLEYEILGGVDEPPDLVHLLFRYVSRRGQPEEVRGSVTRVALRRQRSGAWRIVVEGYHLIDTIWPQRVSYIDEKYADLYDEMFEERARESSPQAPPRG